MSKRERTRPDVSSELAPTRRLRFVAAAPERWTWSASVETASVALSALWVLGAHQPFFAAALKGRDWSELSTWAFGAALAAMLLAVHALVLLVLGNRYSFKPLAAMLIVTTAVASHFTDHLGVYLDPSMLRNVLRSDPKEAGELLGGALAVHLLLHAGLPLLALWRLRIKARPWRRALVWRVVALGAGVVLLLGAVWSSFQPLASLMRNHKEVRYLITPANVLWSLGVVLAGDARSAGRPRAVLDAHPALGAGWQDRKRPVLLVLVVGETARAANWGLSGYGRPTTPQLARVADLINFAHVSSCGTNTETSLPCMFAPVGRRDYDESRIRGSESLLHLLARAGVGVHWLDNQSGCKGVCDGLPTASVLETNPKGLCADGRCLDEGLLYGLSQRLSRVQGVQVLVLHQLGNHGPSYFRRYPPEFARFQPACERDDLRQCSVQQIVNAYDNALLYTDHVLATLITQLKAHAAQLDSAMIYVSDHGESLGEANLFLHGIPYAIAPEVQTRVPMVMWFSEGYRQTFGLDLPCLQARARREASHDHLFHTIVGLLDVRTRPYEAQWDLSSPCRRR